MKKIITAIMLSHLLCFSSFAVTNQPANQNRQNEAYQEGLKAAKEGLENQKKWEKGEGNPEMAKAYQEGLNIGEQS